MAHLPWLFSTKHANGNKETNQWLDFPCIREQMTEMRELMLKAFLYQFQPLSQLEIIDETLQEESEAAIWHSCQRGDACLQSRLSKVKVGDQKPKASLGYSISLPNIFSLQRAKTAKWEKRKREQEYEASIRRLAKSSRLKRCNMKRQGDEEKNKQLCMHVPVKPFFFFMRIKIKTHGPGRWFGGWGRLPPRLTTWVQSLESI